MVNGTPTGDADPADRRAARRPRAPWRPPISGPITRHASLGPSAAVALLDGEQAHRVDATPRGVYPVRAALAHVLGMPQEEIRCLHVDGPGSFGHNGADDVALDAALLARAVPGRPVSLQWTRADENAWEPYGPATVIAMQGSLNAAGEVIDWNHDVWGYTHVLRPRPQGRIDCAAGGVAPGRAVCPAAPRPSLGPQTGIHRNADPLYTFPRRRIVKHFLPDSPLRVSSLRGLGSYANVFAVESFMDEMAQAAGRGSGGVPPALPGRRARARRDRGGDRTRPAGSPRRAPG